MFTPINTPLEWNLFTPRVFRYLEKRYVDDFFEDGSLKLGSFDAFRKLPDEGRLDLAEGKFHFSQAPDLPKNKLRVEVSGHVEENAYIMCGSTSNQGSQWSAELDACICINNPVAFANAVSRHVPGFLTGGFGPVQYLANRTTLGDLPPEINEAARAGRLNPQQMQKALDDLLGPTPFFLKSAKFAPNVEFRFVWLADHAVTDSIFVRVPHARQFCSRETAGSTAQQN